MLEEFITFCESKGNEVVDLSDCNNCALAQFGRHLHPEARITAGAHEFNISTAGGVEVVEVLPGLFDPKGKGILSLCVNYVGRGWRLPFSTIARVLRKDFNL